MVGRQMFLQALLCNCNCLCLLMKRFMKNAAGLLWRPQSLHLMPSRRLLKPFPQVNTFDGLACLCAPICFSRLLIHVVMASHRYFECVYRRTSQRSSNALARLWQRSSTCRYGRIQVRRRIIFCALSRPIRMRPIWLFQGFSGKPPQCKYQYYQASKSPCKESASRCRLSQ